MRKVSRLVAVVTIAGVSAAPAAATVASAAPRGQADAHPVRPGRRPLSRAVGKSDAGTSRRHTSSAATLLAWAPPKLTDPTTITLASGLDPDHLTLDRNRDYVLKMPARGIRGTLEIDGGHDVVLMGGHITVPASANQADNGRDDTDTALYVRGSTGTVHIEGVLIDADPDVMFDGIDVNAPRASVDIENVRVDDVYGSYATEHADVIQTWGGAAKLRVDHLSADGDYQGLTIAPDLGTVGSADLRNIDLTLDRNPPALAHSTVGGGHMVWLTRGTTTCDATPTRLNDVYIDDRSDRVAEAGTVWPSSTGTLACAPRLDAGRVSWPRLPITGSVTLGARTTGPFVPVGVAGSGYKSPGYAP